MRLAIAAALVALLVFWDWNWFRPSLVTYLAGRSGRSVQIDDLSIGMDGALQPVVRLRGVRIENAAWADTKRPMAVAGAAEFTFSWRSLAERRPVVAKLALVDADIDLQRRADGLRNWRLRRPDDRGPGRMRMLTMQPERTRIRFSHQSLGLDITAAASTLASPASVAQNSDLPITRQIDIEGDFGKAHFAGRIDTGALLSFVDSDQSFPLRGHLAIGTTRVEVEGVVADLFKPSSLDAAVKWAGPGLSQLGRALSIDLPSTRPYALQAQVRKERTLSAYTVSALSAIVGESKFGGDGSFDPGGERPVLRAQLVGEALRWADLSTSSQSAAQEAPKGSKRAAVLPAKAFTSPAWRQFDAHLGLHLAALQFGPGLPPLQNLRLDAHLEDGALEVSPVHFKLAGGQVNAQLSVDARPEIPVAEVELRLRQLRLEKILPDLPEHSRVSGPLNASLKLKGQGRSLAALAASADGRLDIELEGGSIAGMLDAKLALDAPKLLRNAVLGDKPVAVRCGLLGIDFKRGIGTARQLWLETDLTQTGGSGRLNLRQERFDLVLSPHSKGVRLLALNKPLRVQGSFTETDAGLHSEDEVPEVGEAGCKRGKTRTGN